MNKNDLDDFLNGITMYRLVLWILVILAGVGLTFSIDPVNYLFSFTFILLVSYLTNLVFAKAFKAPTNVESVWISGLILGLIIAPPKTLSEVIFIGWAAVLAMALKFIIVLRKKHIFNPVAISVVITAFVIKGYANWWVGTTSMLPFVIIGGFLIVRKIRRWDLVLSFLITALLTVAFRNWGRVITSTGLIFFATIMLTEPLTTPPTRKLRMIYGAIVGVMFYIWSPEMALIAGNLFAYAVSPKYKLLLKLKEKIQLTPDTFDFVFALDAPIKYTPGQYMEFTLDHPHPDSRGNRRYLSLSSSPTEQELHVGIKFGSPPSSYKKSLLTMTEGQKIAAGQLIGDFTLPKDQNKKLVLIAGGIGITPYRSMLKYLVDTNQKRDIVVLYSAKNKLEFVYKDVLTEAENKLGIRIIYVDTEVQGHMDRARLAGEIPDYRERTFYISGSHGVVTAFEEVLKQLKISKRQVVTDYFPGFA